MGQAGAGAGIVGVGEGRQGWTWGHERAAAGGSPE